MLVQIDAFAMIVTHFLARKMSGREEGTKDGNIFDTLKQGNLLKSGDPTYTGRTIQVRPNHIQKEITRINRCTTMEEISIGRTKCSSVPVSNTVTMVMSI